MRTIPHVRLPVKVDRILFILSEELKNNKIFNELSKVGFDDSRNVRSNFTYLVIQMIFKLDSPVPDELGDMYLRLLEKHTKKIKNEYGQDELSKRALKMYIDIICEKKRRKTKMVEL